MMTLEEGRCDVKRGEKTSEGQPLRKLAQLPVTVNVLSLCPRLNRLSVDDPASVQGPKTGNKLRFDLSFQGVLLLF